MLSDPFRLNLARNKLTKIPNDSLSNLSQLETLDLSENSITNINPSDFRGK